MYKVRILPSAVHELGNLDHQIGRRVTAKVRWLAESIDQIHPEALSGSLSGFFKLRVGDYRVIYEILENEGTLIIHKVGHRSEVYEA